MARGKTHEQYVQEVFNLVGDEYEVVGTYINSKTEIEMKHVTCEQVYPVRPSKFKAGNRCPNCRYKKVADKLSKTRKQFVKEVKELVGDEYTVKGEYVNAYTHISMKHDVCGHEYPVTPHDFLSGRRCPECANKNKGKAKLKSLEQFIVDVYAEVGDEYSVVGDYVNAKTDIQMKHNVCGHEYPVTPDNFLRGKRCPKCKSSNMEKEILILLEELHLNHKHQKKYDDLKDERSLSYDIAVKDFNGNVKLLVEANGVQHYEYNDFLHRGNIENYYLQVYHDYLKEEYAKVHNIPLLSISYKDADNIKEIILNHPVICELLNEQLNEAM